MRVLLLGGTAFLGSAIAVAARDRGLDVVCLARGTSPAVPGVPLVRADREREDAFAAVAGERWDAVVDVTRQPGQARRAVRAVPAEHWVLISTANVYARFDRPEQREDAPVLEPLTGDVMADMTQYGAAKVACEAAVRDAFAGASIVRSGLIGGDGDWSGRSGYYPWRFAHPTGPDVLVPPDLDFPAALIDARDLAAFVVDCVSGRMAGTFNATGPTTSLGQVLEVAREVVGQAGETAGQGADARDRRGASGVPAVRPVPAQVLAEAGVDAWMGPVSLPLWIDDPAWRWFATLDTTAARAAGLRTRPLEDTLAAALAYEERRDQPRQAGLTDGDERRLRARLP